VLDRGLEVYEDVDLHELIRQEVTDAVYLKLMPQSLNDRLRGGLKKGNHVVAFGRPEAGKSCFAINAACGFARQGFQGLYFINEDRPQDIILRCVANLSGVFVDENSSAEDIDEATRLAVENGFRNIRVLSVAPGTLDQIERMVERYKPDWIVIDQLRNVQIKDDNRVVQLEKAATGVRTIGKKYNCVVVSVTQAGDSASGKAVLDMSDIDSSKTGIPAQADVMIGIGVNDELEIHGNRMLSLPKNKRGGRHESFAVNIDILLSRMTSV
jgi:KaiC/GvpD/RAD55 family RecA-like ATPase